MRTYNALWISGASIFTLIIRTVCNFLMIKVFLNTFGSEINGLIATSRQILEVLNILDGGVGVAIIAMLFKPLAQNDFQKVNQIVTKTDRFFKTIGCVYLGILIVIGILYATFSNSNLSFITIFWLIVLAGFVVLPNFFISPGYSLLIIASQKEYILHFLNILNFGIAPLLMILLMQFEQNFYVVRIVPIISSVIFSICLRIYIYKKFTWLRTEHSELSFRKIINDTWIHQVSSIVIFNTDIIILSIFTSFKEVSVYSIYISLYYIVKNLVAPIIASGRVGLGDLLARNDLKQVNKIFNLYEFISYFIIYLFLTVIYIVIIPFVNIYTSDVSDMNYIDHNLNLLFLIVFLLDLLRSPHQALIGVAGHFKQTKYRSLLEAMINIVASLILVQFYGIYGVLIGTVISYTYRVIDILLYTNYKILKKSIKKTFARIILNSILLICIITTVKRVDININNTDFLLWFFNSCLLFFIIFIIFFGYNMIFEKKSINEFYKKIRTILLNR